MFCIELLFTFSFITCLQEFCSVRTQEFLHFSITSALNTAEYRLN